MAENKDQFDRPIRRAAVGVEIILEEGETVEQGRARAIAEGYHTFRIWNKDVFTKGGEPIMEQRMTSGRLADEQKKKEGK